MKLRYRLPTIILMSLIGFVALMPVAEVSAASLYLVATATTVPQGRTFTIYPTVNTGGARANSFEVNLTFPGWLIQPIAISSSGSICTLYPKQPSYTNSTASFSCGLPNPGYKGTGGRIGAITFKGLKKGSGTIQITSSSKVLANDGSGTNILSSRSNKSVRITDPPPAPIKTPNIKVEGCESGKWCSENNVTFEWNKPSGTTGFSYILSSKKSATPDKKSEGTGTSKSYTDLKDGTYYFKIIAIGNRGQTSNAGEFVLQVDTTPPEDIQLVSEPEDNITELPLIGFTAVDKESGIDHYELSVDGGDYFATEMPYKFEDLNSGKHTITVRAYNTAGLYTEYSIDINVAEVSPPTITKPKHGWILPISKTLEVQGTASPNSTVYLYLDGELLAEVKADDQGNFNFLYDQLLFSGSYTLTARVRNEGGIYSKDTNPITFTIDPYALTLGSFVIPSVLLLCLVILLPILLILIILFFMKRRKGSFALPGLLKMKRSKKETSSTTEDISDDVKRAEEKAGEKVDRLSKRLLSDIKSAVGGAGLGKKEEKALNKELSEMVEEETGYLKEDIEDTVEEIGDNK